MPEQLLLGALAGAYLYLLPGAAALALLAPDVRLDWAARAGLAGALSLSIYALLFLWCWILGLAPGALLAWIPGVVAISILARNLLRGSRRSSLLSMRRPSLEDWTLGVLVLFLVVSRFAAIGSMVAPAWGDSVQHTFIVQLMLDHGGLFQSWAPYAPMQSLTYHFGFHATASVWAWMTGQSSPDAVLVVGQIVNLLAVLALYPLALQLADGNRWAGIGALLIAGLLSPMPAFYVNWGRYTQLAGQVILPAVLWTLDVWWTERRSPSRRLLWLFALLLAGLVLTHYRVALLAALGIAAWSAWGLWAWRGSSGVARRRTIALAGASLAALLLVAPWLAILSAGLLVPAYRMMLGLEPGIFSTADIGRDWAPVVANLPVWLLVAAAGVALLGAMRGHRPIALIMLWCLLCFLATNPFLFAAPGMGVVTNFVLRIALYIPTALVLGWIIGLAASRLERMRGGLAALAIVALVAGAIGTRIRLDDVDPSFQLVTPQDVRAFTWIEEHTPRDARFLVNSFVAYGGSAVVGSDAGWWLPLYTGRSTTLPPLLYTVEAMPSEKTRYDVRVLPAFLQQVRGERWRLRRILCWTGASHVFLGEKRGAVGTEEPPLIVETWLREDPDLELVFESGQAQVWAFDTSRCPPGIRGWPAWG